MKTTVSTIRFQIEYTDTFAGEANYSWVRRGDILAPENISDLAIVRRAKEMMGLLGVRCNRMEMGETIALYPLDRCTVLFITPE